MASVYKRGNRWYANFKNERGVWQKKSTGIPVFGEDRKERGADLLATVR